MPVELGKLFPASPLPGWRLLTRCRDGAAYIRSDNLIVVSNVVQEPDGQRWMHVSCSHEQRPPTLEDLQEARRAFFGPGRTALQVLPPEQGDGPRCVHLWGALDNARFPQFIKAS